MLKIENVSMAIEYLHTLKRGMDSIHAMSLFFLFSFFIAVDIFPDSSLAKHVCL